MKYIFGPVQSRRLKNSLGIDIVPYKTCSLDCIYCECGRTTNKTIKRKPYVKSDIILSELKKFLEEYKFKIDYITITGSGEPTLNTEIGKISSEIKKITNIPLALLTNSTLLYKKSVRKQLLNFDVILPSLDAASTETFLKINRPFKSLSLKKIIKGLIKLRKEFKGKIWLEIFILKNINDDLSEIEKFIPLLKKISPDRIDLNTIDRPPAESYAQPASLTKLLKIKNLLNNYGFKTQIISRKKSIPEKINKYPVKKEMIISIIKRRPETIENIAKALNVSNKEIKKIILQLVKNNSVSKIKINNKNFYKFNS